ncbi:hypothetical protein [Carboxylicivirga marina]|uniref:Phage holin family protein n=1 Tax=Carboxylicivirga marina TaxID=2800988 RepID=A0ABS1HQR5_9BACT|nr:hypothetical protein [Carboxylicivirga marina]MBK3519568.1 hypothetical protein [Carboxylicivirga marina]
MESTNENQQAARQRHGCVTAWLILMIITNSLSAVLYLFGGDMISQSFPNGISDSMLTLLAVLGVANVVFSFLLLKWKRLGFWGFLLTSLGALAVNLMVGLGITQSLLGLIGIGILFAVLQIKKDDVSAWDNLD